MNMSQKTKVRVEAPNYQIMKLKVVGITPLLQNRLTPETLEVLGEYAKGYGQGRKAQSQMKKEKEAFENLSLLEKVKKKAYWIDEKKGIAGFPASGFEKAFKKVYQNAGLKKAETRAFKILGSLIPIKYKKFVINKGIVRPERGAPRPLYRPEFQDWSCELLIRYDASILTPKMIIELGNRAGFEIGVGSWRPENKGNYGMFRIA